MRDFMNIGATPPEEACAQVGHEDYTRLAKAECKRYIQVIRWKLGDEPEGARLAVKGFPHDFGTYHEVVCYFDDAFPESYKYALLCEGSGPLTWDDYPKDAQGNPVKTPRTAEIQKRKSVLAEFMEHDESDDIGL